MKRLTLLCALMIPLAYLAAQTGFDAGRAQAQDQDTLRQRMENAWQACMFPTTSVLGKEEKVVKALRDNAEFITVVSIDTDDVPYFVQHFNSIEPVSNFQADGMFAVMRRGLVWLHFVKEGCVYYYERMNAVQWATFLNNARALKPEPEPSSHSIPFRYAPGLNS